MGVLRGVAPRRAGPDRRVVGRPRHAWHPAGRHRRDVGLAHRRGHRRRCVDRAARHDGDRLRRQPGHRPAPRGARLRPRQPHRHVAQRPADGRHARARRRRPPRARRPDRRPVDGPRLRSRHHRAAAVVQHELHRRRPRRARHRRRLRRRAGLVRLVAGDPARARVVGHALDAARERDLVRAAHAGGHAGPAPRRLLVPPRRRPAGRQGGAPLRAGRLGHRALRAPAPAPLRPAVRGDPVARAVAPRRARGGPGGERRGVLVARRSGGRRRARPRPPRSSPCRRPSA